MDERNYDLNVGRWLADHPEFWLRARAGGFGFVAQHRETLKKYDALTLDELDRLVVSDGN